MPTLPAATVCPLCRHVPYQWKGENIAMCFPCRVRLRKRRVGAK